MHLQQLFILLSLVAPIAAGEACHYTTPKTPWGSWKPLSWSSGGAQRQYILCSSSRGGPASDSLDTSDAIQSILEGNGYLFPEGQDKTGRLLAYCPPREITVEFSIAPPTNQSPFNIIEITGAFNQFVNRER